MNEAEKTYPATTVTKRDVNRPEWARSPVSYRLQRSRDGWRRYVVRVNETYAK